jgi:hypothetical protein
MSIKNDMNTIFRSGSLLIKSGITLGLGGVGLLSGVFAVSWLVSDVPAIQYICGGSMLIITFCIGLLFLFGSVWTLQDLVNWTGNKK